MFRFFKDFLIYGVASVLGKIVAIFLMPIYTSILTKEEYGAMTLIMSVAGIIDLVSNLNIHSGIARDYYEEGVDRKRLVSTGFYSILGISISVLLITMSTRRFWGMEVLGLNESFLSTFTIALLTIPIGSLQSYFAILTRFKKKPILYSVGTILKLVIQVSLSIYGVVFLRAGIISIFYGILVSDLFGVIYFLLINREFLAFTFDKIIIKKTLIFSLPTLPALLAGWVDSSFGQILISKYVSMSELGVYSIALSFSSVFTLISQSFQNVWSPFLYENFKKSEFKRIIRNLFSIVTYFLIIVSLLLSMFSRELVLLLSNEGYLNAGKYIALLCVPMCFYILFPFASSGVSISRDTKYIGIAYILGSCANVLLLFVTIRMIGVIAVPLCLAVSRIVSYCILYKVSEKKIEYSLPNYLLLIVIVVGLLGFWIVKNQCPFMIRLLIVLVVCALLFYYVFRRYDLKSIISLIKQSKK